MQIPVRALSKYSTAVAERPFRGVSKFDQLCSRTSTYEYTSEVIAFPKEVDVGNRHITEERERELADELKRISTLPAA